MKKPLTHQEHIFRLRNLEFEGSFGFERLCYMFNVQDDGIYENEQCPNCKGVYLGPRKITCPKNSGEAIGKYQAEQYADYIFDYVCSGEQPHATDYVEGWYFEYLIAYIDTLHATFKQFLEALMLRDFRIRLKVD